LRTFGLSFGAIFIFAISALAAGFIAGEGTEETKKEPVSADADTGSIVV
jgi:hypothetical protein